MTVKQTKQAECETLQKKLVMVTHQSLPLSCPRDGMPVWNLHPKVYLPIEETGREECPYCSTLYVLEGAVG